MKKSTSFTFTVKAKHNIDLFRAETGLTQPKIINRILEETNIKEVKIWCSDLINESKCKQEERQIKDSQIAKLRSLPTETLQKIMESHDLQY